MKRTLFLLASALFVCIAGCNKEGYSSEFDEDETTGNLLGHDEIVLGEKLEDPYSVTNMTKAVASLYPTKADRVDITPTNIYARFLPASEEQFEELEDMGLEMLDHPLDYQIVKDGDYYHDPDVPEDEITWQYCVLPHDFGFPDDIQYEILDYCYISDEAATRADDGIDWDAVEAEAYRLTGNEDLLQPSTRASSKPEGRITIVDDDYNKGKPFGVAGVKVVCNSFVKFSSAYTDRDGYYAMSKKYSSKVRYRLLFKNTKGFSIGFNKVLVPASTSALGKASAEGLDVEVSTESDRKLFCRCAVNNSAYDYIMRCEDEDDMNLTTPPSNLRFWIFYSTNASSAVMLKHGAVVDNSIISQYLGIYSILLKIFLPDITIGMDDIKTYSTIYSTVCHELAHASHFSQVGKSYWNNYIKYILTAFISGEDLYGDGSGSNAGYCEIGEMWGYFMQNLMYNDRYGGTMPSAGMSYWFKPQIMRYLYEGGLSRAQIFAALQPDVTGRALLKEKLVSLYPESEAMIELVFTRYAE